MTHRPASRRSDAASHIPRLSRHDLLDFADTGLLRGFGLFSPSEVRELRAALMTHVLQVPSTAPCHAHFPPDRRLEFDRYLDSRLVYEICTLPRVLGPICQILGPNVMVFRQQFFNKPAGGLEIPWHQESYFWSVPAEWITLWLAIDDATSSNGAIELVLGSHRYTREHGPVPEGQALWPTFREMMNPSPMDKIASCPMDAGEFLLFDDLAHRSPPNRTSRPRLSFTARFAKPSIALIQDDFYPNHACVLVSGHADGSTLRFAEPPPGPGLADLGICAWPHEQAIHTSKRT